MWCSACPCSTPCRLTREQMSSAEIDAAVNNGHRGASLYHVKPDVLCALRPDLILTQDICEVCAVSRRDVELATRTLGYAPRVLSLSPVTLDQVVEDIDLVARVAGIADYSVDVVNE